METEFLEYFLRKLRQCCLDDAFNINDVFIYDETLLLIKSYTTESRPHGPKNSVICSTD